MGGLWARYVRQLGLLGEEGQERLSEASVAVVGLGGLGSAVSLYLAAAGVGRLILVDPDRVEPHNLNRQVLYDESDVGLPKAFLAARRVRALNPLVRVEAYPVAVGEDNVGDLLGGADVIVDGLDNWEARLVLDRFAWREGKPLVHAAAERWYGQLTVVERGRTSCLACLAPERPGRSCTQILGPVAGMLGLMEALEVIKLVTGVAEPAYNRLVVLDARSLSLDVIPLDPRPCPRCPGE